MNRRAKYKKRLAKFGKCDQHQLTKWGEGCGACTNDVLKALGWTARDLCPDDMAFVLPKEQLSSPDANHDKG